MWSEFLCTIDRGNRVMSVKGRNVTLTDFMEVRDGRGNAVVPAHACALSQGWHARRSRVRTS